MTQMDTTPQGESGARAELPNVVVENCGDFTLHWECQNYTPGKNRTFNLEPGEKDQFEYDYARRIFGDWEVDPRESNEKRIEWNGMIAHIKRKSPSNDGKLAQVKVHSQSGELLWDAMAQMEEWLKTNIKSKSAFAAPKGSPMKAVMPQILEDASYDQLKELWLKAYGSKMPHQTSADVAKAAIMPHLTADQIATELKEHYSGEEPDMSDYAK